MVAVIATGTPDPARGSKQTTEAEGNQDRLDAQIAAAQTVEGAAQGLQSVRQAR